MTGHIELGHTKIVLLTASVVLRKSLPMAQHNDSRVKYLFTQNRIPAPVTFRPQKYCISSLVVMTASYQKRTAVRTG